MVEMTTQLPTARHQSASRRTGSNLHQVNRDTAPQRHPDHSASQVSRTDAYQVNPSLLAGILLISPLRKLRNSSKNEYQLRAAQNGCSLAGSPSSTSDCGGLSWLGNCAKCAIRTAQNCAICARRETQRTGEEGQDRTTTARTPSRVRPRNEKKAVTLADASRMATLCEPSQAPKYGLKYGPAHTKKDKPATGAGLRGICGGETGIRTLGGIAATIDFESIPFGHSGISPRALILTQP